MNGTIVKPPYSTLTAYDLNTGTIKWQVPAGGDDRARVAQGAKDTGYISQRTGIITTSAGLLFQAGGDGKLRVYDSTTAASCGPAICRPVARHSGDVRGQRPPVLRRERDLDDRRRRRAQARPRRRLPERTSLTRCQRKDLRSDASEEPATRAACPSRRDSRPADRAHSERQTGARRAHRRDAHRPAVRRQSGARPRGAARPRPARVSS